MKPNTILAAFFLMSGSAQVWAAPAPVSEAASSSQTLEERISQLESMMRTRNLLQAELQQQLNLLQEEVSQVRGVTEEQSYKLEKVLQRQRELYQEIENRVSQAYDQSKSTPATADVTPEQAFSSNLSENEAYDRTVNMIMKDKRYDAAIPEFQNFLQQYPNSVYVPNAHYWLGQLFLIKSDDAKAKSHFATVVDNFPESNKRPEAMLKLGTIMHKQGQAAEAKTLLNKLIKEYPSTTPAKLATERLAKM
ncbi:tol-pal system protein YbgF [Pseudoalteromonas piscicida]|uniref:Cell division coordinator CpoB n=1 Tax=Pseudoalteromonas piscicida TaxID=43662 RepID=A0A2A5JLS9_PSEO7|nr:tol-pal system protein YbgF [Pseudoalteromonas piscicida]PCK30376.1 tol-pal system protein YbgF [Pseudoalteromonas piscicida]